MNRFLYFAIIVSVAFFSPACNESVAPGAEPDSASSSDAVASDSESTESEFDTSTQQHVSTDTVTAEGTDLDTSSEADSPEISITIERISANCMPMSVEFHRVNLIWNVEIENGTGTTATIENARLSVVSDDGTTLSQTMVLSTDTINISEGTGIERVQKSGADDVWLQACDIFCSQTVYKCDENGQNCVAEKTDYSGGDFTLSLSIEIANHIYPISHSWYAELECGY